MIRAGADRGRSTRSVTGADGAAPSASSSPSVTPGSKVREGVGVVALAILGIVLVGGYATWRVGSRGGVEGQRPAAAIVVMGAAQYNGRPSRVFQARLDHAVELYKSGVAPVLV